MNQVSNTLPRPSLPSLQRKAQWIALLLLAITLHVFEAAMPGLGPWFKPGLANVMTLLALQMLGAGAAFALAIARVLVGAFLIGTLFTPTVIVSLAGALTAASMMLLVWRCLPRISLIGVSLVGALAHMVVQFLVVENLFIHQLALYYLLPPLLLLSCFTGWFNGALAGYILWRMKHEPGRKLAHKI